MDEEYSYGFFSVKNKLNAGIKTTQSRDKTGKTVWADGNMNIVNDKFNSWYCAY